MGCDIHATIEYEQYKKKYEKTLKKPYKRSWYPFARDVDIGRNYSLFATLANVRNNGTVPCLSEPRGVPEDASWTYKEDVKEWEGDGHSHSYFTFEELDVPEFKHRDENWFKVMHLLAKKNGADNVRLVFFFDN